MSQVEVPTDTYIPYFKEHTNATTDQALMFLTFYSIEGMMTKDMATEAIEAFRVDTTGKP